MALERLQKILARAGVASRRACEELVTAGRVTVDGRVITELGAKADPQTQEVRLDGRRVRPESLQYWMLNKPKGVVCTNDDPAGRTRPLDFIPDAQARLFPVGRLDADSKGLLLLTNDGALANRLTHPRYEVPKTYQATVAGRVTGKEVQRLVKGAHLAEAKTGRPKVKVLKRTRSRSVLQVTIREGRNRQIRRVLARLGHPVRELVRTRIGRLSLRGLGPGKARRLTPAEVEYLKELPDADPAAGGTARGKRRTKGGAGRDRKSHGGNASARRGARQRSRESTKRSTDRHETDGAGKTRRDQRRRPDSGQHRGGGPGHGSPARGRRPPRDPQK
ncbi:MAG: pseudouridine synthase [Planctomycetota bacterium]|nr:pseudouridine synthase [Planctomycetota bacterium]